MFSLVYICWGCTKVPKMISVLGDGFPNSSRVMLEHGHSLIIKFTAGSGSANSSLWTGKDFLIHSCCWWENVKSSKVSIPNHSILISISTPAHICCLRYAVLPFTFAGVFHLQNCENRQYGAGTIVIVWTINVSFSKHFAQEEHCICLYFCTRPLCVYSTEGNLINTEIQI